MKILKSIYISSKEEVISFRLQVINFQIRYGTRAAVEAYKVSRATIFRWKRRLKEANFDVEVLMDKSKVPKRKRKREVPKEIEDFIIRYREEHPGVGKEAIKYNLDLFCEEKGIKKISESTVGRIIKDLKEKGRIMDRNKKLSLDGRTGNLYERKKKNRRKKLRLKGYKPEGPGDLVRIDSLTKFVNGIKRYIITATDVFSRFSFAYIYKNLSRFSAMDFMKKLQYVAPLEIKKVQTDNGKEFVLKKKKFPISLTTQNTPKPIPWSKDLIEL